ncbi:alpha/beta hydrolase-fold protein [Pedobacter frigiditerrae]|uniref:carboxylesterase family protein n=1 Tax=Pedobacter frigiditerrae TaxID=2530452 RepID=UPI00293023DD|nr:PHB depolymerase family esterase [Pedobacter frigiditerrae]
MQNIFKPIPLFLLFIFNTVFCFAQTQNFNNTKVDSLTFLETRKTLNNLPTTKFEKRNFKQGEKQLPYRLLLPKNYTSTEKYPLVITFHNSTRIGNDNENQLEPLSRIWLREEIYDKYKCFVLAPQFNKRSSNYSENEDGVLISKSSEDVAMVLELIKILEKEYPNIDSKRIYLVGYSMGASTAQNILNREPKTFARMVSIAAVPDYSNLKEIKNKNIWLIHGQKDIENPYNGSVELFKGLKKSKNLIFTTFSELDHNNINIPFLLSEKIPQWLFKQSVRK